MPISADKEKLKERVRGALLEAEALVWNKPGFPPSHRPDTPYLLTHIRIANGIPPYTLHPNMKPSFHREFNEYKRTYSQESALTQIAWYDALDHEIVFGDAASRLQPESLRRATLHEAATSVHNRKQIIKPELYTSEQREWVEYTLIDGFKKGKAPGTKETRIERFGFEQHLRIGKYFAGTKANNSRAEIAGEVYPTISEIITDQIIRMGGNIDLFDQNALTGSLKPIPTEDHPIFASNLFDSLRFVNWRVLLEAFNTGDLKEAMTVINKSDFKRSPKIILNLLEGMEADEKRIQNTAFKMRDIFQSLGTEFPTN